jgi:hypothetical protein
MIGSVAKKDREKLNGFLAIDGIAHYVDFSHLE